MNIVDFISKLNFTKAKLIRERSRLALIAANDLSANIKLRLQERGGNSDGAQFSPYTKPYKKDRVKNGYQIDYVDFTRTGRLMANVNPKVVKADANEVIVNIGARSAEKETVLRGLSKKRGNILTPSKGEILIVAKQHGFQIVQLIKTEL